MYTRILTCFNQPVLVNLTLNEELIGSQENLRLENLHEDI